MEKGNIKKEDNAEYIFTESSVDQSYEHNLPIDKVIELGSDIYNKVKIGLNKLNNDNTKIDEFYHMIFNEHKYFASSFPIVLRWMVYMNKFSTKAFKKYLIKYSSSNINNKRDFLELQAEYLVFLFKEEKHYTPQQISSYRNSIINQLLNEEETFLKIQQEIELETKEKEKQKELDNRNNLYNYIKVNQLNLR